MLKMGPLQAVQEHCSDYGKEYNWVSMQLDHYRLFQVQKWTGECRVLALQYASLGSTEPSCEKIALPPRSMPSVKNSSICITTTGNRYVFLTGGLFCDDTVEKYDIKNGAW